MTPEFLQHMRDIPGSCSPAVKESHWKTWQSAIASVVSASGAPVVITTLSADERSAVVFPKAEV